MLYNGNILLVEDDAALAQGVRMNLELAGYVVCTASNLAGAEEQLKKRTIDLLLLDVNLPDGDGVTFAKQMRNTHDVPLIFLTAKDMDEDMIVGFEAGADDYITKPFHVQVLLQRVRAVLRRYHPEQERENIINVGNLKLDLESYQVLRQGKLLSLTPTEFKLLVKFCQNPGIVLTRRVLLEELWDKDENYVDEHTLTIFVSRLRSKIADEQYSYIKTVYGTGYRWIGEAKN